MKKRIYLWVINYDQKKSSSINFLRHLTSRSFVISEKRFVAPNRTSPEIPNLYIWRNLHGPLIYKFLSKSGLVANIFSFDCEPKKLQFSVMKHHNCPSTVKFIQSLDFSMSTFWFGLQSGPSLDKIKNIKKRRNWKL